MKLLKINKLLILASVLSLSGCSLNKEKELTIVCPTGAPAVAFYKFATKDNFESNNDANNIVPMMVNETVDIAVLPTNVGIQAINNKNINYNLAATITFGNIFIVSTGNDNDDVMDEDDYIVSFQKGAVPDKIFHYVYGDKFDNTLRYVPLASDAAKCLKTGKNTADNNALVDYVVLAEPAITTILDSTPNRNVVVNLQNEYKAKSGNKEIFQASIFIKNSVPLEKANSFLNDLKKDIIDALENPSNVETELNKIDNSSDRFGVAPSTIKKVLENGNGIGLGFKDAKENKEAIDLFMSLFGIGEVDDKIYL